MPIIGLGLLIFLLDCDKLFKRPPCSHERTFESREFIHYCGIFTKHLKFLIVYTNGFFLYSQGLSTIKAMKIKKIPLVN